jgi:hypothetical protein
MYYKENFIGRNSPMFSTKLCISFLQKRFRSLSLFRLILIIGSSLLLLYLIFLYKKDELCDPTDHLYWFCPWPDPKTTVCSWNDHFSIKEEQIR